MTKPNPTSEVADEVPWSDGISEYDNRHVETYIRLLDADNEGLGRCCQLNEGRSQLNV